MSRPSDIYTHGHSASVLRSHTWRTVENSAGYLAEHLVDGAAVLDVGAGPGTISIDMAQRVGSGSVIGIELSQEVLIKARAAVPAEVTNIDFRVGDVYSLDFDDDSFDIVHAHQVLQHLSDPVSALREMRRVAKPGGVVAARDADYQAMFWAPSDPLLDRWMEIYQAVARSNDAEPDAARFLLGWASEAGFSEVEATASMWCFANDTDREWWGSLWADRMLDSALADQAIERGIATRSDLEGVSAAFRDWVDKPGAWFGVPHGEILAAG
ncbi:MAG: methyltransferase domain-containing protein [Acidimicrobiales bacterium]